MKTPKRESVPDPITTEPRRLAQDVRVPHFDPSRLRAFTPTKAGVAEAYATGQWLRSALCGNVDSRDWCMNRGMEFRVQTESVNTAGGFLVPTEMEAAIIKLRDDNGVFRRNCRVVPMASDHKVFPRWESGPTGYWVDEVTAITASDTAYSQVGLTVKKYAALTRMSTDVAEDAIIDLADSVARDMAYAFALHEDQCGFIGDGTGTYGGIVGITIKLIDGAHAAGDVVATAGNDTMAEYTAADFLTCIGTLPEYAHPNAKWYCHRLFNSLVFERLKAAGAGNTFETFERGGKPMYLGYPVETTSVMSSSVADVSGTIVCLFGDLSQSSYLGEARGFTIAADTSRYFEYDQIAVKATQRFDINNANLGGASTPGALVGLEAET